MLDPWRVRRRRRVVAALGRDQRGGGGGDASWERGIVLKTMCELRGGSEAKRVRV